MTERKKAKLGDQVKDEISGLSGIAVGMNYWLNGCIRVGIQPKTKKGEFTIPETQWADSNQIKVVKSEMMKPKKLAHTLVELGDLVKDTITGFSGAAVACSKWLNGTVRIAIQPPMKKGENVPPDSHWVDCEYILVVEKGKFPIAKKPTEGPKADKQRHFDHSRRVM